MGRRYPTREMATDALSRLADYSDNMRAMENHASGELMGRVLDFIEGQEAALDRLRADSELLDKLERVLVILAAGDYQGVQLEVQTEGLLLHFGNSMGNTPLREALAALKEATQ